MDPNQALLDLTMAFACGDIEKAKAIGGDLRDWLLKGGFTPTATPEQLRILLVNLLTALEDK